MAKRFSYARPFKYLKYGQEDGYEATEGCFAQAKETEVGIQRVKEWESCRELFDTDFRLRVARHATGFLFFCENHGHNVARFIHEAEKRLGIEEKSVISGFKNVSNVCYVRFSRWWLANSARRQLYTILLRAGLGYTKNAKFTATLNRSEYGSDSVIAMERFFDGYTHWSGRPMNDDNGWDAHFNEDNTFREVWDNMQNLEKPAA